MIGSCSEGIRLGRLDGNSALAVKYGFEEFVAMDITRQSLVEHFQLLSDDELLAEFQSGELTDLAKDVAAEELGQRKIDQSEPPSEPPVDRKVTSISGDLVMVARYFTAAEAYILRNRLELKAFRSLSRMTTWRKPYGRCRSAECASSSLNQIFNAQAKLYARLREAITR